MCFTSLDDTFKSIKHSKDQEKGQITSYCFQFLQHVFFHKCVSSVSSHTMNCTQIRCVALISSSFFTTIFIQGLLQQILTYLHTFTYVHAVYFISNAAKMRLVLNFSIFRVVAYFRCLASLKIIVIAQPKMHKNSINLNISEKIGENKKKTVIFGFFVA